MNKGATEYVAVRRSVTLTVFVLLISAWFVVAAVGCAFAGPFVPPRGELPYMPNEALVTMKSYATPADIAALKAATGSTSVQELHYLSNLYLLTLPGTGTIIWNTPVDRLLSRIKSCRGVAAAQRNYKYYIADEPNDTWYPFVLPYSGQWALQPTLGFINPVMSNHIYAQGAWDIEKGASDVVVAVIDSGIRDRVDRDGDGNIIRYPHPDLGSYKRDPSAPSGPCPPLVHVSPNEYMDDSSNNRLLLGWDTGDWDDDPSPSEDKSSIELIATASHGTHVGGIIAAKTNNDAGVAALCWNNVWILPLKVFKDTEYTTTDAQIAEAIAYCIYYDVDVINMSLGGSSPSVIMRTITKQAARAGIVLVAAAGNRGGGGMYPPTYPGAYEDVICVGATYIDDLITDFSQQGRAVDIAAPGEDILSTYWSSEYVYEDAITAFYNPDYDPIDGPIDPLPTPMIPMLDPDIWGNGYNYASGTSMSSPMVAAAAALLRSLDVPPGDVKQILCETATPVGIGRPNDAYGWGLLNVEAALKAACVDVKIQSPITGSIASTMRPKIRIDFRHADMDTIRIEVDGVLAIGPESEGPELGEAIDYYTVLDYTAGKGYIQFEYTVDPALAAADGTHRITASAETDMIPDMPIDPPLSDDDEVTFKVRAEVLGYGWHLFSIPYMIDLDRTPQEVLGTTSGILARWNYASSSTGSYALYVLDGSREDEEASFAPPSAMNPYADPAAPPPPPDFSGSPEPVVHPLDSDGATPPAGLGYWLYILNPDGIDKPEVLGEAVNGGPYVIRLYYGWNMVGDPFAFPVNWSSVIVEYAGTRVTASEAVARGWLSNCFYRYDSAYSRYTWKKVDSAVMMPWEAQWMRVRIRGPEGWPEPDLKLIVPPSEYSGVTK